MTPFVAIICFGFLFYKPRLFSPVIQVDIAFDDEDSQLYHTIQNLAHISKCPILLTSEQPLPFFKALHAKHVKFTRPDCHVCSSIDEAHAGEEGRSDALRGLLQNIRSVTEAALAKSSGSSSHAASYSDVTVLDEGITFTKQGSNSKSSSAALAAMFGSTKKPIKHLLDATVGPTEDAPVSSVPPSSASALASLSESDLVRLQVLCGLSDGDLRAALASVQLFPEHFLGATKPNTTATATAVTVTSAGRTSPFVHSSAVVDLTSSPAAVKRRVSDTGLVDLTSPPEETEHICRQEVGCSFGRFLSETLKLDFALFDSSLQVFDAVLKMSASPSRDCGDRSADDEMATEDYAATLSTDTTTVTTAVRELYVPVVHDVLPRFGLVAGGFLMTITGAHFMQHSASSDKGEIPPQPAEVRVFLNGHIPCPCVLKSDTSIVAYVSPVRREGVFTVHVEVHAALSLPSSQKVVVARSVCTGIGAAWIHLRQRYFPLVRSANNSSQKLHLAPTHNRAATSGDTQSTDDLSPGSASSSDEGRAVDAITERGDRRVAKRLWSCTQEASEHADSTSAQGGASSSKNHNNQRRKRRVISDDSDEASDNDSEAPRENKSDKSDPEDDDMSLAESEDDEASDEAPVVVASVKPAASTADASLLQSLVEKVQSSLLATLNKVKCNGHSEPFLLPVDDRDVPGYSQVCRILSLLRIIIV